MSENVQRVPSSVIAKLLVVTEQKLDQLVKDGIIPSPVRGKYELINSVRGYIGHLRNKTAAMDQSAVARHLDMSDRNLRDVLRSLAIEWPADPDDIRIAYIRDLREKAAGRAGEDQVELTRMRIRESRAKTIGMETQNLKDLGLLIAITDLEPMLEQWATVSRSEVSNALMKIVADIEGEHDIAVNQDMVNGHISAAYKLIGDYPGRYPEDSESVIDLDDEADREEMDSAEE